MSTCPVRVALLLHALAHRDLKPSNMLLAAAASLLDRRLPRERS